MAALIDDQLLHLALTGRGLPGVAAAVAYRFDAARGFARVAAQALHQAGTVAVSSTAHRQTPFVHSIPLMGHPVFQQLIAGRACLVAAPESLLADPGSESSDSPDREALLGTMVHVYPLKEFGAVVGALAFFVDVANAAPMLPATLEAVATIGDDLLAAACRLENLESVNRVAGAVISRLEVDQVLAEVVTAARTLLRADRVVVWLYRPAEGILERRAMAAAMHSGTVLIDRLPLDETAHGLAVLTGQPVFYGDVPADPRIGPAERERILSGGVHSLYSVPILFDGRPQGTLGVGFVQHIEPDPELLELAQGFAGYVGIALHNAQEYDQMARRARELEALHRIGRAVVSLQDMPTILQEVAEATLTGLQADRVALWLSHTDDDTIELRAVNGLTIPRDEEEKGCRVPITTDAVHRVIHERQTVTFCDEQLPVEGSEERRAEFRRLGLRGVLIAPIVNGDQVLGLVSLGYLSCREFSTATLELVETIASHAAAAISNAELYERATQRAQEMALLNVLSARLTANLDLTTVLGSIAEAAVELCQADGVSIWGVRDGDLLESLVRTGKVAQVKVPTIPFVAVRPQTVALKTRKTLIVPDIQASPMVPPGTRAKLRAAGISAAVMVPMVHQGREVGVISLGYSQAPALSAEKLSLLEHLATHAATAMTNARRFQETSSLAARDGLTGLLNHREFYVRLREELARTERTRSTLSLVLLDLDDFKQVNDRYGHQVGDITLQETARVLQREVRLSDLVARYGGEEFAIILPGANKGLAMKISERVRDAVSRHRFPATNQGTVTVTVSIGVATFPDDGDQPDRLMGTADRALYRAKSAGKNRIASSNSPADVG